MSMFEEFKKVQTLADGFVWGIACSYAGIPCLFVAPPSGGKSTVIFSVEKYLKRHGDATQRISRLGLRGLSELAEFLGTTGKCTLINEEYASIGSTDYMTEKMGELIGALSYSGSYVDHGLKIELQVERLGFISGIQPLWIKTLMTHPVFATHVREKFLRYYFLPHTATEDVDDLEAEQLLNTLIREHEQRGHGKIPTEFMEGLAIQVGLTRAKIYALRLARALAPFFARSKRERALRYFGVRLGFEKAFVMRDISAKGFEVETNWRSYHALYWALRRGEITGAEYMFRLGVTSMRSVERCLSDALRLGWVASRLNTDRRVYLPNPHILSGDFNK